MRGRIAAFTGVAALAALALSCGPRCPANLDGSQPAARRIMPGVVVKDSASARCDRIDWKEFSYFEDVRAVITYSFGGLFKPHNATGTITVYTFEGNVIERRAVLPGQRLYRVEFLAAREKQYFLRLEVTGGAADYMVETEVKPGDACGGCAEGQTCCAAARLCCLPRTACTDSGCVRTEACEPACADAETCVQGRCESVCPGGCPGNRRCDAETRTCAPEPATATSGRHRAGRAAAARSGAPKKGACGSPSGKCDAGGSGISGTVLNVSGDGDKAILLINRGSEHGIRVGASGTVAGVPFRVVSVTATRCKAKASARPSAIPPKSRVRFAP